MDRKKIIYIGIILIITVIVSITYFSYAFFTKKDEYHGRLNIVAGQLKYRLESTDLENNSITLSANTTKEIEVEITSLNNINSEYSLYYDNSSVEIGYKEDSIDLPSGSINNSGKKKVTLIIKNKTSSSQTVIFGVKGGFSGKTISLSNSENPVDEVLGTCPDVGTEWVFSYTGDIQNFEAPCAGKYRLEVWGAQGGKVSICSAGGQGGYSKGDITLDSYDKLSVVVGGTGNGTTGGYNGGGSGGNNNGQYGAGGGGATHIARYNSSYGLLSSYGNTTTASSYLLVVAGGGGGCGGEPNSGAYATSGAGGGSSGAQGVNYGNNTFCVGGGASQSAGGANLQYGTCTKGSFGQGAPYCNYSYGGNGGGGGYFGGGGTCRGHAGAGGGSGYIGGVTNGTTQVGGRTGNGYARITYLGD